MEMENCDEIQMLSRFDCTFTRDVDLGGLRRQRRWRWRWHTRHWDDTFYLSGSTPLSYDQNVDFISGYVSSGATFEGSVSAAGTLSGSWNDPDEGDSGTFQGSRIGGALTAEYRFTGTYDGDDDGLFVFDVDAQNNITGVAYSISDDDLDNLTGTLSGTTLSITTDSGATVSGTLNTTTGSLYGSWQGTDGDSGSFSGAGCKLN
jgi:hypothetical protein